MKWRNDVEKGKEWEIIKKGLKNIKMEYWDGICKFELVLRFFL